MRCLTWPSPSSPNVPLIRHPFYPSSSSGPKSDNSYSKPTLPLFKQHFRLLRQPSPRASTTQLLRHDRLAHRRDTFSKGEVVILLSAQPSQPLLRLYPDHVCGFRCEFEITAFFSMPLPACHPTTWTATCPVDFQQRIFEAAQDPMESFDSPFSPVLVWNVEWKKFVYFTGSETRNFWYSSSWVFMQVRRE
jgi:hypothetical protein